MSFVAQEREFLTEKPVCCNLLLCVPLSCVTGNVGSVFLALVAILGLSLEDIYSRSRETLTSFFTVISTLYPIYSYYITWFNSAFLCVRLTSLDELDCSFNEIEALPSSVGQCASIRTFAADHNFLTQLPPEVSVAHSFVFVEINGVACQSCPSVTSEPAPSAHGSVLFFYPFADGQLEECNRAVPTFQQAGVFAWGDGRHAEAEGHQPQQQQVSLDWRC